MPTQNSQDLELAKFFTDVEPLRDWFDKAIVADTLPKRLLVIHGVGCVGFVRMSYCNSMENLEEALTRIERLVKNQR
ncbi:MAG: hypothetical protein HY741_24500 [Chloroflexi bacterium]|nr:hypothetical protein [Chloroflexota bacterium]